MGIRHKIKNLVFNSIDIAKSISSHAGEKSKFKDPRRKAIYETVELTEEQKNAIDVLYKENYGKKIPYTWHKHFTAYTGNFDEKYFPELLFIPEFEKYMNLFREYCTVFADKNVTPQIAATVGIKTPMIILSCAYGILRDPLWNKIGIDEAEKLLKNAGKVFCKPTVDSCSGRGCMIADFIDGTDQVSQKSAREFLQSFGENFVIQERLKCHESISSIYGGSVNTFRIITYRWKDDIFHCPVIMRIGRGDSFLDNAHAGGMFIAVDDDGQLHREAFTEFKEVYSSHPDTNVVFAERKIPLLPEVIKAAEKMHYAVPQVGCVNWDFTIDTDGVPVLIEANIRGGSIWLPEMAHGKGPFGENTVEILRWLKIMNAAKPSDRPKYAFGKME